MQIEGIALAGSEADDESTVVGLLTQTAMRRSRGPTQSSVNEPLHGYSVGRLFGFSQAKALSLGSNRSAVSGQTGKWLGAAAVAQGIRR